MPAFEHRFEVRGTVAEVAQFHYSASAFRQLSPPGLILQLHRQDPVANGSVSDFTMWMGPIPIHWVAEHSDVGPEGFTDTQISGPMKSWVHRHRFEAVSEDRTRVVDHIEYEHDSGWRGLRSRLLFSPVGLKILFAWRAYATKRGMRRLDLPPPPRG